MLNQIIVILSAYALGCFAVGYYLVRWRTGQDLREIGSGATGGRNSSRALGKSGAIITGFGDILKGVLAMWIALRMNVSMGTLAGVMVAVLLGHIFPIQLGWRGGKGLSAAFGAILMYDYRIALLTAVIALALWVIPRKRKAFLFLMGVASSPLVAFLLKAPSEIVIGLVAVTVIILYAHQVNLRESWNLIED